MGIRLKLQNSLNLVIATMVLHNIAIERNEEMPPIEPEHDGLDYDFNLEIDPEQQDNGVTARDLLIQNYFPTLL